MFLDDFDTNLASMKILPGTHKRDLRFAMNSLVSKRMGLSDKQDNLVQSNWIYDEFTENFNIKPELLVGERGVISMMNSSVLHAASENLSPRAVKRVAILNYARKSDFFLKEIISLKILDYF